MAVETGRRVVGSAGVALLALLPQPLLAAHSQGDLIAAHLADRAPAPSLVELHARFSGLAGEAFLAQAAELLEGPAAEATLDALVLRLGADPPTRLPGARRERRDGMRADALALLEAELQSGGPRRERVRARLALHLDDPERAVLWAAAARAAVRLGLHELAPRIAAGLDPQPPPSNGGGAPAAGDPSAAPQSALHCCAQRALFDLYRRWFPHRGAAGAFLERAGERAPAELFVADLAAAEERAHANLAKLVDLHPPEALAALGSVDPRARLLAPPAIGRAVGQGRLGADAAMRALFDALDRERDPAVVHAVLDALFQMLGSQPVGSKPIDDLRTALAKLAGLDLRAFDWPLIDALSRLRWETAAESTEASNKPTDASTQPTDASTRSTDATLRRGIDLVSTLLARSVRAPGPLDCDQLVLEVEAWRNLCQRDGAAPAIAAARAGPVKGALEELLRGARVSDEVRVAVASTANILFTGPELLDLALGIEQGSSALRFELLGAVARMLDPKPDESLDPNAAKPPDLDAAEPPDPERVFALAMRELRSSQADLRRRALELLATDPMRAALEDALDGERRGELLALFEGEANAELKWQWIEVLAKTPRREVANELRESVSLAELAEKLPRRLPELAAALTKLAQGEPDLLFRFAQALAGGEGAPLARVEHGLKLIAAMGAGGAETLTRPQHEAVVRWADLLRRSDGATAGGPKSLEPLLRQIYAVHIPGCLRQSSHPELSYLRALFGGDLHLKDNTSPTAEEVLGHYEAALAVAALGGRASPERVRRDRARFLFAINRRSPALEDYERVLASKASRGEGFVIGTGEPPLQLSDLRQVASLVGDPALLPPNSTRQMGASRASDLLAAMVAQDAWLKLPANQRVQDLEELARQALASGDASRLARARAAFADLPQLPATGLVEGDGARAEGADAPRWSGLLRERAWHESLAKLGQALAGDADPPAERRDITPPIPDGPPLLDREQGASGPDRSPGQQTSPGTPLPRRPR